VVSILTASVPARPASAQSAPAASEQGATLLQIDGGTAVALDPRGFLYITDARKSAVVVVQPDGTVRETIGGAGTQPGQFDAPADLDPTNGLTLWVADAGNGRLQHISQDGQFLEVLPLTEVGDGGDARPSRPVFDATRGGAAPVADGEPIAIATTAANELFAVDARRSVVVKWDAQRRAERVIGGFGQRQGSLRDPVDLSIRRDELFIADRQQAAILVYDAFGTYRRTIHLSDRRQRDDLRAVHAAGGYLWVATDRSVLRLDPRGGTQTVIATSDHEIADIAVDVPDLYILTDSRLLRMPGAARGRPDTK